MALCFPVPSRVTLYPKPIKLLWHLQQTKQINDNNGLCVKCQKQSHRCSLAKASLKYNLGFTDQGLILICYLNHQEMS